jgi:hypothetical protein
MIQNKNLKALCCGEKPPAVMQSFTVQVTPHIGFLHSFSHPDFMTVIQNGGKQQSNLYLISAGYFLRVKTMRPDPFSSVRIEERRSGTTKVGRGFLQLFSQTV